MSSEHAFPSESGMPVFMKSQSPTVSYFKAEVKSELQSSTGPKLELVIKGVANYKRHVSAGVFSPITEKFHGAGVDSSMHIAFPFEAEVSYRNGQIQVTLKETKEPEYQREQTLVQFDCHPYTTAHSLLKPKSHVRGQEVKTIKSRNAEQQKEVSLMKHLGVDLKIKVKTEESGTDFYKYWEDAKVNVPVFMASLPTPITSCRRTTLNIVYNPRNTEIRQLDLTLGLGMAKKTEKYIETLIDEFGQTEDQKLEKICSEFVSDSEISSCKEELKRKISSVDKDVSDECEEEKTYKQQQQQQQQQQAQQSQQFQGQHQQKQAQQQRFQQQQQQQQQQQEQQQQLQRQQLRSQSQQCKSERQLCKEVKNMCIEK